MRERRRTVCVVKKTKVSFPKPKSHCIGPGKHLATGKLLAAGALQLRQATIPLHNTQDNAHTATKRTVIHPI